MTDDEIIEAVISERLAGKSVRAIARQLNISIADVNATLDGLAEELTPKWRLRAIGIQLARLDAHLEKFSKLALDDGNVSAGELVLKILARQSALVGLDAPTQQRLDVTALQNLAKPAESTVDRIEQAIARLAITGPPSASHQRDAVNGGAIEIAPPGD